jgi:hypothetical protein
VLAEQLIFVAISGFGDYNNVIEGESRMHYRSSVLLQAHSIIMGHGNSALEGNEKTNHLGMFSMSEKRSRFCHFCSHERKLTVE